MKKIRAYLFGVVCVSLALSGCGGTRGDDSSLSDDLPPRAVFPFGEPIVAGDPETNPADAYLVTSEGKVFLSWTAERSDGEGRNLFIARVNSDGEQFTEIRQANQEAISGHGGENLAKFAVAPGENVAAIWNPFSTEPGHPGLPLKLVHAESGGSFSPETVLNDDQKEVHRANFSGIGTSPDGKIFAAWLDGRNDLEAKQLFMAVSEDGGRTFGTNYSIAPSACPCCRPSVEFLEGGQTVVVAYRQNAIPSGYVNLDSVRDHVMIRSTDGGKTFSDPVLISDDGWVPIGCPHTGISIDVDNEDRIHALWWTAGRAPDEAGIYYTHSEDAGRSFLPRQLLFKTPEDTVLHTQVAVDKNGTVYASWVGIEEERPHIFFAYRGAGQEEWSSIYNASNTTWNAIYPMMTVDEERLYVAWTERKGEASQVKLRTAALVEN